MQTFLPYASFTETATVLDYQRLGKQRVETLQILMALGGIESRWRHHPAVKMWTGCELTLARYGQTMCREWRVRGYSDNTENRILELVQDALVNGVWLPGKNDEDPWWLGKEGFHKSHRSNLIRKDPGYYGPIWPDVPDCLPYVWPDPKN